MHTKQLSSLSVEYLSCKPQASRGYTRRVRAAICTCSGAANAHRLLYERPQLRRRGYVLFAALTRLRNDAHAARVLLEGSGRAWANLCREGVFKAALDVRGHVVLAVDYDNVLQPTGHAQLSLSDLAQVARVEPHTRLAGQHIAKRRLRKFRLAPVAACCQLRPHPNATHLAFQQHTPATVIGVDDARAHQRVTRFAARDDAVG
eukprot:scaffold23172_cov70-Phaeocystis_antarctica.AAC.1